MAKGSLDNRLAVASEQYIPEECASELYLQLSKDDNPFVRSAIASNQNIPQDSVCRVLGRLNKDKNAVVRKKVKENGLFDSMCDGNRPLNYNIEPWYGFDVLRADVHCRNGCNYQRLMGELEAQDADVASIRDWRDDDTFLLKDLGFDFIPSKISWQLKTTDYKSFNDYLDNIIKGDYIRRRIKRLNKDNIHFILEPLNNANYRKWYALYNQTMIDKRRGRIIIKENDYPSHLTAIYAMQNDKLLGGILINTNRPDVVSGAYGAFLRNPVGLSDVAMAKMVEYAIDNKKNVNLGMDTNFYGFHLGTGLYSYKTSLGYTPKPLKSKEYFKVLNDKKFDNPYMYLSFPSSDTTDLQNNIFIRDDAQVNLDQFKAPKGAFKWVTGDSNAQR